MLFANIRPAILTLIKALVGDQGSIVDVIWRDQTARYVPTVSKTVIKLSLGPVGGKGWPDRTYDYDSTAPLNQEMTETVAEYRRFTLKILCECFDQSDSATAWNYLEMIRTKLGWSSSVNALAAVQVAVYGMADLIDLSRTVDNRILSSANLDVSMSTTAREKDVANPVGYIGSVSGPTGP